MTTTAPLDPETPRQTRLQISSWLATAFNLLMLLVVCFVIMPAAARNHAEMVATREMIEANQKLLKETYDMIEAREPVVKRLAAQLDAVEAKLKKLNP